MQLPPMYSARKIGGVRLYELARKGQTVERSPKEIEDLEIEILDASPQFEQENGCQDFDIRVVCFAGTYIRTLAEDIGTQLRVGAHLRSLRRLRSGRCELSESVTLEELAAKGEEALQPVIDLLGLPVVEMTEEGACPNRSRSGERPRGRLAGRRGGGACLASRTLWRLANIAAVPEHGVRAQSWGWNGAAPVMDALYRFLRAVI